MGLLPCSPPKEALLINKAKGMKRMKDKHNQNQALNQAG